MTISKLGAKATFSYSSPPLTTARTATVAPKLADAFEASTGKAARTSLGKPFTGAALADRFENPLRPVAPSFKELDLCDPAMDGLEFFFGGYRDTKHGELYGAGGPKLEDIRQGSADDCWFLGPLGSLVHANPNAIRDMIRDNNDGTYSVRLYAEAPKGSGNYVPEWVDVDDDLPRYRTNGAEMNAAALDTDGDGREEVWVAVIEKAMAMHMGKHFPEEGTGYGALDYDLMSRGMAALTGKQPLEYLNANHTPDGIWVDLQRVNSGGLVSVATPAGVPLMNGLMQLHCYTVTGVVEINGQRFVDLRNPYGKGEPFDGGRPSDGVFRLTYEDFLANFAETASLPG